MEIPRTAALVDAELKLSADGGQHSYLLFDPVSGRSLKLTSSVAAIVSRAKRDIRAGRLPSDESERRQVAKVISGLEGLRREARGQTNRRFNPLFISLPLFAVTPFQMYLRGLASHVFGRAGLLALIALMLIALWMSVYTEYALVSTIDEIFSVDAILTFAILAPFLKVFHELGHVLAATRFNIKVRKAGIILVAFYPMPFVDCSEADVSAGKRQRIVLSLAGVLSDVFIGLLAFVAWHATNDPWLKQLFSSIFFFNTVTTLFFNANPLLKLDGYFALSDFLNRRNFHYQSSQALKATFASLREWKVSEMLVHVRTVPFRVLYAIASMFYKVYVILLVAWILLPKFLGLGAVAVVWGGALMFLNPFLASGAGKPSANNRVSHDADRQPTIVRSNRYLLLLITLMLVLFLPVRCHYTTELWLDTSGEYAINADRAGSISDVTESGLVSEGDRLVALNNEELQRRRIILEQELELSSFMLESVRGQSPISVDAATARQKSMQAMWDQTQDQLALLSPLAPNAGHWRPNPELTVGAWLEQGDNIGSLIPDADHAVLIGKVPEIYVEKLQHSLESTVLRYDGRLLHDDPSISLELSRMDFSDSEIERLFELSVIAPISPEEAAAGSVYIKLQFDKEPVWRHLVFWLSKLRLEYFQSKRLSESGST